MNNTNPQTTRVEISQEHDRTWTARVYRDTRPIYITKGSATKEQAHEHARKFLQLLTNR